MFIEDGLLRASEKIGLRLRQLYDAHGYAPYKMSKFEPYDLYAQNRSFVTGDRILTFTDTNGHLMALKPDVTLSIVKNYKGGQRKVRYQENVYRDTGASGEFREILQAGVEFIGDIGPQEEREVLKTAADSLSLISPEAVLNIASVACIASLLDITPVDDTVKKELTRYVQRKSVHELRQLCRDQTIPETTAAVWEELCTLYGPAPEALSRLRRFCTEVGATFQKAVEELSDICCDMEGSGIRINLDFSVVGGLRYYNGLVFKGYVPNIPSAILSGGRYDGLVKKLGKQAGAVGFAVYLDLLE